LHHIQILKEKTVMTELTPQEVPPGEEEAMMEGGESQPSEMLTEEGLQVLGITEAMPQEIPSEMEEAVGEASGTWYKSKKITALWSINQNRNSWIGVSGLGWRKLANNSDSAVVALTMLASHAKQTGRNVDIREESDQIKEMYAW
jgi:hypothetical protein